VSAEFDDLAQTTKYSQPADGSSGNLEVTKSDTGVYTIGFSDGDSVQFALTTGQTTGSVDENDPAGLLIVAQSTDGSKTNYVFRRTIFSLSFSNSIAIGSYYEKYFGSLCIHGFNDLGVCRFY